jgi:prepilin signal peptidase PulO-like enzyme (type II secretory pathway)
LLAFFTAPFLGIGWAVLSVLFRQVFHRKGTALPYGPHLATATMMVILFKPAFEQALSTILSRSVNIP